MIAFGPLECQGTDLFTIQFSGNIPNEFNDSWPCLKESVEKMALCGPFQLPSL